jgi:hypothetical protein
VKPPDSDADRADDQEQVSPQRAAERLRNAMAVAYHDQSEADRELVEEDWAVSVETWPEYEDA